MPKALAQQVDISGYVKSATSNEAVIGAVVCTQDGQNLVVTNEYGYFSLSQVQVRDTIRAFYTGSQDFVIPIDFKNDTSIIILLKEQLLEEVEVTATSLPRSNPASIIGIPIKKLREIPNIGGESDILKSLTIFPGVATGAEGTSNIYVRGGTPDQNLILLDGLPVYNVSHLGGFLSVFNTDALRDVKLYKGAYPARYGGRLSSIIDVRMKEGNPNEYKQEIGIGILTSKFLLEGPIEKQNSSFLLTGRSSYLGFINSLANNREDDNFFNYWLYDINAKMNFSILGKGKLFFSYYTGRDTGIFKNTDVTSSGFNGDITISRQTTNQDQINWGNSTFSTRFTYPVNNNLFFKSTFGYTQYRYSYKNAQSIQEFGETDTLSSDLINTTQSRISSLVGNFDFDFTPVCQHFIRFGWNIEQQIFQTLQADTSQTKEDALINALYLEDDFKVSDKLTVNAGLRFVGFLTEKKLYPAIEPRIKVNLVLGKKIFIEGAFTRMTQFIHLITPLGAGLPNDIWLPANNFAPPERAQQYSLGIFRNSLQSSSSIETFYKKSNNLLDYKVGASTDLFALNSDNWEDIIEVGGQGETYGLELFQKNKLGKLEGSLSYTLSWNYRQFDNVNQGKKYFFNYDRRHDISILLAYRFNEKWSVNSNWVFQSGRRVTLPVARVPAPFESSSGVGDLIFSERNNGVLPNYHRLDIGLNFEKVTKKKNVFGWNVNIYNSYNRQNASYLLVRYSSIRDEQNEQIGQIPNIRQVSLFSFIPAFSVYFKL